MWLSRDGGVVRWRVVVGGGGVVGAVKLTMGGRRMGWGGEEARKRGDVAEFQCSFADTLDA